MTLEAVTLEAGPRDTALLLRISASPLLAGGRPNCAVSKRRARGDGEQGRHGQPATLWALRRGTACRTYYAEDWAQTRETSSSSGGYAVLDLAPKKKKEKKARKSRGPCTQPVPVVAPGFLDSVGRGEAATLYISLAAPPCR